MNIIILGPPGSGKGTQSEFLTNNFNLTHFSTGDLLRNEIKKQTSLGKTAQGYMNQGIYVPSDVMNDIVGQELSRKHDNIIFDGYPRTIEQVQFLTSCLQRYQKQIDLVIYLKADETTLINRLTNRLVCPTCSRSYNKTDLRPQVANLCDADQTPLVVRADDSDLSTLQARLTTYKESTEPLIAYFENLGIVHEINAAQSNKIIHQELTTLIE